VFNLDDEKALVHHKAYTHLLPDSWFANRALVIHLNGSNDTETFY
jgi:hypothetical protein